MIVVVMMLNTIDRNIISILLDDVKADLALSDQQMGWILGPSFTLVYAISVLPLARWADQGVRRNIIALGLGAWSLFTIATGWVQGFVQLFVMRMGVGIGEASASPAIQSLVSDTVPPEQRSRDKRALAALNQYLGDAVGKPIDFTKLHEPVVETVLKFEFCTAGDNKRRAVCIDTGYELWMSYKDGWDKFTYCHIDELVYPKKIVKKWKN